MAGGVAILLGTLLGINFPMGGQQTANAPSENNNPTGRRESSVLPANINVNSTATRDNSQPVTSSNSQSTERNNSQISNNNDFDGNNGTVNRPTRVAQSNANTGTTGNFNSTRGSNTTNTSTTNNNGSSSSNSSQNKRPIRALW
jgi:hypothetical protein